MAEEQTVNPWMAKSKDGFNYEKLIDQFGLQPITKELIEKLESLSDEPVSTLLRRQIFFAHQDLDKVIEAKKAGKPLFIYTGRGPSKDALHLGHMLPMLFTAYLQKVFDCYTVIEMSDDEKFYFKEGTLEEFMDCTESNAKDIIASGFNPEKTFIFSSFKYRSFMQPLIAILNKKTTMHVAKKIYGFEDSNNLGQLSWPPVQEAPALCGAFPHLFGDRKDVMCLVPCAVDQSPYFRELRHSAESLGFPKPALICAKFLVSLAGPKEKASSTGEIPPIFVSDNNEVIREKIVKYAFSGGGNTLKEHKEKGGNLSVDVPYIYLYHFLEDEKELARIAEEYSSGRMSSKEIKELMIAEVMKLIERHRMSRASITDEVYRKFFSMRVVAEHKEYFTAYVKKYVNIDIEY